MMNRIQYLLLKCAEESSEVSQMAIKTAQFGLHEVYSPVPDQPALSNIERLKGELVDQLATIQLLNKEAGLDLGFTVNEPDAAFRIASKITKIEKYYNYSVELGQTQEIPT